MNEPTEYETCKKEIRSLLITFKNGCSLSEFKKEFKMMMGYELPFIQNRFRNEIEFLYSMPDVVQVTPNGRDHHLKAIADQTTKHIQKLVSKQKSGKLKSASPSKFLSPPPGFPRSSALPTQFENKTNMKRKLPPSIIHEVTDLLQKYHNGLNLQDIHRRYRCYYGKELIFTTYGFYTLEDFLGAIPWLILRRIGNDLFAFCSSQVENSYPRSEEKVVISKSLQYKPVEPYKKNIVSHIKKISPQNWDTTDKLEMVHSTKKENFIPGKRKMDCLDNFDLNLGNPLPVCENYRNDPKEVEDFPPNAFSSLKQYTQQRLPTRLVLGSFFQAYVANIFNPGHMYIQLGDEEKALSDMNHALEKFYTSSESKNFVMKDVHIKAGSIGVAQWPIDMHWYRIEVMSVISDFVKVFFVDYGTEDIISKTLLRYVREDFVNLPAQAMRASLAYVKPPKGFSNWSQRATDRILALSLDESVKAKVEDIEDDVLFLILYNKNDIYINGTLLDEHLAQSTSIDSNCPELIGLSKKSSSASNTSTQKLPPTTCASTAKACMNVPSTSQASKDLYKKPSVSLNFSKPFEVASTSVTGPKSQTTQNELPLHQTSSEAKETSSNLSSSSSSCYSEIFDDDDDAFFEEFYQKISLASKRYVKRVRTSDGYVFHILMYESKPYVSCGDISNLIWSNKDFEFMLQQLQKSGCHLANVMIWENENVNMFEQLRRFNVKGLKVLNDRTCLLVFHLNNLINILNMVGHPSVELRTKIIQEYSSFDPDHPTWKELSEVEFSDVEEEFFDRTDDDKLNRLCLYDLHVMKENIRIRHQKLQPTKSWSPESVSDEQHKLYVIHQKVVQRMREIQQICSNFSNA